MGFFSSQETQPNYWYYQLPNAMQVEQEAFYGQVESYTTYTNQLWDQWSNYASMASDYMESMQSSATDYLSQLGSSIESKYSLMKKNIGDEYKKQEEYVDDTYADAKKRKYGEQRMRGMANVTREQSATRFEKQRVDTQTEVAEARAKAYQTLEAQKGEWDEQMAARRFDVKNMTSGKEFEVMSRLEGMKPLMMNPGPAMKANLERRMIELGEAGMNQDIVTGESPGWGSTILSLGGAAAGAAFGGPTGMMLGSSLGQAVGGGLEGAFGGSSFYRNQGMNQMFQGGMSAMMLGTSPFADWSFDPGQQYGQSPFGNNSWLNFGDYNAQMQQAQQLGY